MAGKLSYVQITVAMRIFTNTIGNRLTPNCFELGQGATSGKIRPGKPLLGQLLGRSLEHQK